jgi:hypothetical protein
MRTLTEAETLQTPIASDAEIALSKLSLLAELTGEPETRGCATCGVEMSAERAQQTCETCKKRENRETP